MLIPPVVRHARPLPASAARRQQRGLTLLEISFLLAALLALAVGLSYKTGDFFRKSRALDNTALLQLADNQLRQFTVAQGRLPCPDLTGDGIADDCTSGQQKGYLPYITLGMADKNYGFGEVPMLYGVYNAGSVSLASTGQTFFSSYASESNTPVPLAHPQRNVFDFCASLRQIKGQSLVAGALSMAGQYNAAFALAVPGDGNRDGAAAGWTAGPTINAQYDGLNATTANQFELPEKAIGLLYDDKTAFRSATDLFDDLRCESMNSSVDLLAEAVSFEYQTRDFAKANADTVRSGLTMNGVGIALAIWQLGQSIAGTVSAAEVSGVSAGLLATASATCPIPPFVTCALIPVYSTAVTNASIGVGLAVGAAAAAGASLGLQTTSTVMYAKLKERTSTPPSDPTPNNNSVSAARLSELRTAYATSKNTAVDAYSALGTSPNMESLQSTSTTEKGFLDREITGITDDTLKNVLATRLNGDLVTCPSTGPECVAREVPDLDSAGNIQFTDADKKIIKNKIIYTKDNLGTNGPGVRPALKGYADALQQSGALPSGLPSSSDTAPIPTGISLVSPGDALTTANTQITNYGLLLEAVAAFDAANITYQLDTTNTTHGSARTNALATLRTRMGDSLWETTTTTSLCGSGGCGWMLGQTPSSGSSTSLASTRSSQLNGYVTAEKAVADAGIYEKKQKEAAGLASRAWLDRNAYKNALCTTQTPPVSWIGSSTAPGGSPSNWDATENVLANPVTGLSCTGSATPLDTTAQTNAERDAQKAKVCGAGAGADAALCALYNTPTPPRSAVIGVQPIVNTLIQKGIVQ
jgi:hypothetical protein